jgi:NAD(P)H-quinone oxidoreductase subunit 5
MQTEPTILPFLLGTAVAAPLGTLAMLLVLGFIGVRWREELVARLVGTVMIGECVLAAAVLVEVAVHGAAVVDFGDWYHAGRYVLHLELAVDRLAAVYLALAAYIGGIVGFFSVRYLHREAGFTRFFGFYLAFIGGLVLVALAANLELLIAGWELVGLSSVFLVGFYHRRRGPAAGAMRIFATYKLADIGLLGTAVIAPFWLGHATLPLWGAPPAAHPVAPWVTVAGGLLLLVAAAGKAAQLPFSAWLPRAMEGPTPSSAIFYGALSVHCGAYLLLRTSPLWSSSPTVSGAVVATGLVTAAYAAFVGRTRTDVKSLLAYAAMAQLGLIFAEIGFGLGTVALAHVVGHSLLRTLQFLRAPSALGDAQRFGYLDGTGEPAGETYLERLFPRRLRIWLYRQSFAEAHWEALPRLVVVQPLHRLAAYIDRSERAGYDEAPEDLNGKRPLATMLEKAGNP